MRKLVLFAIITAFLFIVQTVFAQTPEQTTITEQLKHYGLAEKATSEDIAKLAEIKLKLNSKKIPADQLAQRRDEIATDLVEIYKIIYKLRGITPVPTDQQFLQAARGNASVGLWQFADCAESSANNLFTPLGQLGKVEKFGKGKTTLILISDSFADSALYKNFIERNQNLYTMYSVTLPSDGGTSPPPKPEKFDPSATTWLDNAELAVANFIQKQKLKKPIIIGIQAGAYLAAKLALNHSDKVGSVVLLNGLVYPSPLRSPSNPEKIATLAERKRALVNRNFTTMMISEFLPQVKPDRICADKITANVTPLFQSQMLSTTRDIERAKQIYVDGITTSSPRSIRYTVEFGNTDLTEDLKNLKVPMLSIPAVRDYESPPNIFAYPQWSDIKARYPNIPLTAAPFYNTRGYINEDAPQELDQAIADFVAGKADIKGKSAKLSERLSPRGSVMVGIGNSEVSIVYGRPQVKGRKIWGNIVPYKQVWRSGADEATTITFTNDVLIEGQKLAAGKYTFFTIPDENEWTLIFNKSQYQWGAFYYSSDLDVLRIKVKPQPAENEDSVKYYFNYLSPTSAEMVLHWEKVKVAAKIETVKN